jgi:hypothetical protein
VDSKFFAGDPVGVVDGDAVFFKTINAFPADSNHAR